MFFSLIGIEWRTLPGKNNNLLGLALHLASPRLPTCFSTYNSSLAHLCFKSFAYKSLVKATRRLYNSLLYSFFYRIIAAHNGIIAAHMV